MGLDITIDGTEVWHGAYSAFYRFRKYIARMAGICLEAMWGYADINDSKNKYMCPFMVYHEETMTWLDKYDQMFMDKRYKPIKFPPKEEEPLVILLDHSDCDGKIDWQEAKPLADRLFVLYNRMNNEDLGGHIGNIKEKTKIFIDGLYKAFELQKDLIFH